MSFLARISCLMLVAIALGAATTAMASEWDFIKLPPTAPPELYGTFLIDRASTSNNIKPVVFSHWLHRIDYTCRVCHFELEFEFKRNTTEITEELNRNGFFCGACHDGKRAFGHTPANCDRCHTGDLTPSTRGFSRFSSRMRNTEYGNKIDWVRAARKTNPAFSIFTNEQPFRFSKLLELRAEYSIIPPALFPHVVHVRVLDCSNCHPDVFNLKKKTTKHFRMDYILEEKFCGVCHLNVAFPLNDCKRCHPAIGEKER